MFARRATSSRRSPGVRRRSPDRSPTTAGARSARRRRRKSASSPRIVDWMLFAAELIRASVARHRRRARRLACSRVLPGTSGHAAVRGIPRWVPWSRPLRREIGDELVQQGGELRRVLLLGRVAGAGDDLDLAAPQGGGVELAQVVEADELLAVAVQDG